MQTVFIVHLARALFVTVSCLLGILVALGFEGEAWLGAVSGTIFALFMVLVDILLKNLTVRGFSSATFGLLIGVGCAWLVTRIGVFENPWMQSLENADSIKSLAELMLYSSLAFLGVTLAVRSDREEFSFIIPYVRFRKEASHDAPILLDTNVIIDGRIEAIYQTGFLSGSLIVPKFVLNELQLLADSKDEAKGARGKKGLESLRALQEMPDADVTIYTEDYTPPGEKVDSQLVSLARAIGARILTNDLNLGKVADLQKVQILNVNDLARALHPTIVTGDTFTLTLTKKGREDHQAVGYLDDGTMIVVNEGINSIGKEVKVKVETSLQTSAGRLVFAGIVSH